MKSKQRSKIEPDDSAVAIYHVVYESEDFNDAAGTLFKLVQNAEQTYPGKRRKLFLDIDGHRNSKGGFDSDMMELQKEFMLGFLGQFLTQIHSPLINVENSKPQNNDIPDRLDIQSGPKSTS